MSALIEYEFQKWNRSPHKVFSRRAAFNTGWNAAIEEAARVCQPHRTWDEIAQSILALREGDK